MKRAVVLVCAALAAGTWLSSTVTPAIADARISEMGWWTDRPEVVPAPEGGFEVAASFDGTSVAALRIAGAGTVSAATLTLTEAGVPPSVDAAMVVCRVSKPWAAASGGPLSSAPATSCTGGVALTRNADRTWTADIAALVQGTEEIAIGIVPAPGAIDTSPLGGFDPGFVAQFETAVVAVTNVGGPTPTTSTTSPTATTAPGSGASTGGGSGIGSGTPDFGGEPAIAPSPVVPAPVTPPTIPPSPVAPASPPVDENTADELAVPSLTAGPISGPGGSSAPWGRLVILIPLSAAAGVGSVQLKRLRSAA